ncbi:MAG: VOC family protein [Christensenellales bacterium]
MVTPSVAIPGRALEAVEFYEKVFKGQNKRVLRFGDVPPDPDFPVADGQADQMMYAEMTILGTKVSFSGAEGQADCGGMISLAVDFPAEQEVREVFSKLQEGGQVVTKLAPQLFSPLYGRVKDKFGVDWQVICRTED